MVDRVKAFVSDVDAWLKRHRTTRVGRRAVLGFLNHEALQYAGSMAYFAVLSIFQLLVLGVVVFSLFLGEGEARNFIVEQVEAGSPLDRQTITGVIDAVIESRGGMTAISIAFLLWSALGVFSALNRGIMRAFVQAEPRPFWQDKLIGLFLMALTGILVLASLVIGIVTGVVLRFAEELLQGVPGGALLLGAVGLLVPLLLIFIAFLVIYRVVPNRPVSFAEVWPGALVAALLWTVLRIGFTYYATSIANYDSAFGPISTAITLLVFLYFASIIVLIGAEVARANVVDDELAVTGEPIAEADDRYLPVPTGVGALEREAPKEGRRLPRWALVAGAALVGVVAGRLTKRDDDYD